MVDYFSKQLAETTWPRPRLNGVQFKLVSEQQNDYLAANFTLEEIEESLRSSDGDKSSGPDGFNFAFFKSCWDVLKEDVLQMFSEFYK